MKSFKQAISIMTLSFFLSSILSVVNYSPVYAKRAKRKIATVKNQDPYLKYTDEQLLAMAQRDYNTAVKMAVKAGVIGSEADVVKLLANASKAKKLTKKQRKALAKRKINTDPSYYIGQTRYVKLKKEGIDINKASFQDIGPAKQFLKKSKYKKTQIQFKYLLSLLQSLLVKKAYAQTSTRSIRGRIQSQTGTVYSSDYYDKSYYSSTLTNRMDEEDLEYLEEIYEQPSVADSWDKTKAMQQKSYKTHDNEIKHTKFMGYLLIAAGALLLWQGWKQKKAGEKKLNDKCNAYIQNPGDLSGNDKDDVDSDKNPGAKISCKMGTGVRGICDRACNYKQNDSQGESQVQMGYIMMLAGAALIIWGMSKLGEAASLEDEESEQKRRNQDIEKARDNMLQRDEQKKENQMKIFEYRRRTKQLEEKALEKRRRELESQGTER